ncbi:MAG: hypothetical protein NTY71_06515 [Methanoregula sp.]|nr:hypothetical protein [Methanoregula sp.]
MTHKWGYPLVLHAKRRLPGWALRRRDVTGHKVGVPPHVLRGGGQVIVLKTPHAIADGVLIGSGGGYTPCPQVGGATLLSSESY